MCLNTVVLKLGKYAIQLIVPLHVVLSTKRDVCRALCVSLGSFATYKCSTTSSCIADATIKFVSPHL